MATGVTTAPARRRRRSRPTTRRGHLDDRDVDGGVGERGVRHGDEHLKKVSGGPPPRDRARVDELDDREHLVVDLHEALREIELTPDGDPLEERVQVRRGEPADVQAHRAQQRVDHPRRPGLAVRAGDVDDREAALRVAEQLHDLRNRSSDGSMSGSGARERIDASTSRIRSVQLELVRGVALGGIGGRAHPPIVHAGGGRPVRGGTGILVPNRTLWFA